MSHLQAISVGVGFACFAAAAVVTGALIPASMRPRFAWPLASEWLVFTFCMLLAAWFTVGGLGHLHHAERMITSRRYPAGMTACCCLSPSDLQLVLPHWCTALLLSLALKLAAVVRSLLWNLQDSLAVICRCAITGDRARYQAAIAAAAAWRAPPGASPCRGTSGSSTPGRSQRCECCTLRLSCSVAPSRSCYLLLLGLQNTPKLSALGLVNRFPYLLCMSSSLAALHQVHDGGVSHDGGDALAGGHRGAAGPAQAPRLRPCRLVSTGRLVAMHTGDRSASACLDMGIRLCAAM